MGWGKEGQKGGVGGRSELHPPPTVLGFALSADVTRVLNACHMLQRCIPRSPMSHSPTIYTIYSPTWSTGVTDNLFCRFTLEDVLQSIQSRVCFDDGKNLVNVYRQRVLDGGFRAVQSTKFDPWKPLDVCFAGEYGIDNGGLQREFLRLAMSEMKTLPIFDGPENSKTIVLDHKSELYYIYMFCLYNHIVQGTYSSRQHTIA